MAQSDYFCAIEIVLDSGVEQSMNPFQHFEHLISLHLLNQQKLSEIATKSLLQNDVQIHALHVDSKSEFHVL